jgi:hypothetical protein
LRKPPIEDVEIELIGHFPLNNENPTKYPVNVVLASSQKSVPVKNRRLGHYTFTVSKEDAQTSFEYVVTFPFQKGWIWDVTNHQTPGKVYVGKAKPFSFRIDWKRANPAAEETLQSSQPWTKTVRNSEIANGVVGARELFSSCVLDPSLYELTSVRLKDLGTPAISYQTSCARCGNGTGAVTGWNADQVQYRLRALSTGLHRHGHWYNPTVVERTNRSATVSLKPVFVANRLGIEATEPWKTDQDVRLERDDLRDFDADLGAAWAIDIKCDFEDGSEIRRNSLTLTPIGPQLSRGQWSAAYDGHRLRIETR